MTQESQPQPPVYEAPSPLEELAFEDLSPSPEPAPPPPAILPTRGIAVTWEMLAWAALLLAALAAHLWHLDVRTYHYDESIHAWDSWKLFYNVSYTHSPWSHGPWMYFMGAAGIGVFGDTLAAPRVMPALFGVGLAAMPLLLRGHLGRWGALAAGAMLAFSPSLLYFSRFLREDIFAIVFDLALVGFMWKYIATRKNGWLYGGAAVLALSFAAKETAYISVVAITSFLALWWLRSQLATGFIAISRSAGRLSRLRQANRNSLRARRPGRAGFVVMAALVTLPLSGALVGALIEHVSTLTLVLSAESNDITKVGSPQGTAAYAMAGIIVAVLFGISAAVAISWRFKVWLVAVLIFYGIFFTLYTTLFTNMLGMGTGIWQALGYWIAQQPVERAGQPWYYYLMTLGVYEFLPVGLGLAAIVLAVARRGAQFLFWTALVLAIAGGLSALVYTFGGGKAQYAPLALGIAAVVSMGLGKGSKFDWFLTHWALLTVILYIVAGEKMPWLTTHLVVPFALLAGKMLGQMFERVPWRAAARGGAVILLLAVPGAIALLYALATRADWQPHQGAGIWGFIGPLIFAGLLISAAAWLWIGVGTRRAAPMLAMSLVRVLSVLTLRASFQASFANADDPKELFLYSQPGPGVRRTALEIERLAATSGKGDGLRVLADTSDAAFAPWRGYLRGYKDVAFPDLTNTTPTFDHDVLLVARQHAGKVDALKDGYVEGPTFDMNQWFNPFSVYQGYTIGKFWDDVRSAGAWNNMLRYYAYRDVGTGPSTNEFTVFYAKPLLDRVSPAGN